MRKRNWVRLWSAITGVALTIALVLTFLPIQIDIDGLLSIKLSHSRAAADNHTTNIYASASDGDFPNSAGTYNAVWTDLDCTPDPATYMAIGQSNLLDAAYEIKRGFIFFDTSTVSAGATITAASLNFYGQQDLSTTDFNITIQTGQPTYPHNPAVAGDYAKGNYSGDLGHLSTSGFTTSGYNTITLNSDGIGNITKGGETKFFIRSDREIAGTVPTSMVGESVYVYCSEQAGTSKDPYLAITYTLPFLDGWDQRVEITIDAGDIDADLTNFPVLLYLSNSTSGINNEDVSFVFDELGSDANRKKIAVTKADGTTQMHVEIEKWDDSTEQAWLWVSNTTWAIDDATNTTLYLYYDADHADNTDYVGDTNSAPAEKVWDSNFLAVYHMADGASTSAIYDSTSNNRDGTKGAAANPNVLTTGKISDAQNFDAAEESIGMTAFANTATVTVEAWVKPDSGCIARAYPTIIEDVATTSDWWLRMDSGKPRAILWQADAAVKATDPTAESALTAETWYYIVELADGSYLRCYKNVVEYGTAAAYDNTIRNLAESAKIGTDSTAGRYWSGVLDEIRVSNTNRSTAWIKATYETERDDLVDWGVEEASVSAPTVTTSNATNVLSTTATLNGNVTATGGENPTVTVYWGTADGGTTWSSWANNSTPTLPSQPQGVAAFYKNASSLSPSTIYYFSAKGTNSGGTGWATTKNFTTESACSPNVTTSPSTWSVNGGTPVTVGTNYTTGLTYFNTTNNSGGSVRITIGGTDMIGGGYTWDLDDDGNVNSMVYAMRAGLDGGDYTIIVRETATYNNLTTSLANGASQLWGLKLSTPTVYSDGNAKVGNITLTAACI